ncbi:MAG: 50S ribosomal protein L9 [Vampirovibrionales bacterium]|jgi:large subunit ribosomal protein L9
MDVILLKPVENLGEQGDVVRVSDGHARNMLFPRNLAVFASEGALRHQKSRLETIERQAKKRIAEDQAVATKIEAIGIVVIKAAVGEEGKLFGTITPKELGRILSEKSGIEVDRRHLTIERPLNRVGAYDVSYRLSSFVEAKLVVEIQAGEEA